MSFKLGGIIIEDLNRNLSAHEKLILACYGSFALHDGTSIRCAQSTIAGMAMCSDRAVRQALKKFQDDGVMLPDDTAKTRGRTSRLKIVVEQMVAKYGPEQPQPTPESHSGSGDANAEPDSYCKNVTAESQSTNAESQSTKAERDSGNPGNPGMNPSRARGDDAGGGDPRPPPACAHWNENLEDVIETCGESSRTYFDKAIVLKDDLAVITLAVPSKFYREIILGMRGEIERVLGRRLEIVVKTLQQLNTDKRRALQEREAEAGRAAHG